MLILAFDTTSDYGGAGVYRDLACLAEVSSRGGSYSTTLFEMTEALLARATLKLENVELLAVTNGPGSFTGIRVGLAAALGWSKALGRPARAVSTLEALVEAAQPHTAVALPILDARRGEFYLCEFRRDASLGSFAPASVGWVVKPESLAAHLEALAGRGERVTCVGRHEETAVEQARALLPRGCEWQTVSGSLVGAAARLAFRAQTTGKPVERGELDAYYIRRSDAARHWSDGNPRDSRSSEGGAWRVRQFLKSDVSAMLAIQAQTAEAARWSEVGYTHLAGQPGGVILVAEAAAPEAAVIAGFAAAACAVDEAELQNLAVGAQYRRQGIARALLSSLHERLRAMGVRRIYLEVRPSNHAALALYRLAGYRERSRRKDYYQEPAEDALVFDLALGAAGE